MVLNLIYLLYCALNPIHIKSWLMLFRIAGSLGSKNGKRHWRANKIDVTPPPAPQGRRHEDTHRVCAYLIN